MSKLIKLYLNNAPALIKVEAIDGFGDGAKQGTGYVLIHGVLTPVTANYEASRLEWLEKTERKVQPSSRTFQFKDREGNKILSRFSDVKTIREGGGHYALVVMENNVIMESREDYAVLVERFGEALED